VEEGILACGSGHRYPLVEGIPVLLTETLDPTHPYCAETLHSMRTPRAPGATAHAPERLSVDPFVQQEIIKTNGNLYRHLKGRLPRYPIPDLRLSPGDGALLLDVGCNWGRWTLAAARKGYRAIGLDPSLEACLAAQRVCRQLGVEAAFVAGDARALPFGDSTFGCVFSYSVLQHFEKKSALRAIGEMGRVLNSEGTLLVQMPNLFGARQLYNRFRQILRRESGMFRVRYWTPGELKASFSALVGPCGLTVDGFFSLNPQATDLDLLTPFNRFVVQTSETLRGLSDNIPAMARFADSLYVTAGKTPPRQPEP
jgi:SAM-dependent methyltransferase